MHNLTHPAARVHVDISRSERSYFSSRLLRSSRRMAGSGSARFTRGRIDGGAVGQLGSPIVERDLTTAWPCEAREHPPLQVLANILAARGAAASRVTARKIAICLPRSTCSELRTRPALSIACQLRFAGRACRRENSKYKTRISAPHTTGKGSRNPSADSQAGGDSLSAASASPSFPCDRTGCDAVLRVNRGSHLGHAPQASSKRCRDPACRACPLASDRRSSARVKAGRKSARSRLHS